MNFDSPSPTYTAAKAIAADLAEYQLRSNIADMFIENAAAKAAAVRAAVEADPNRANTPAQHEYKMTEWTIYGACYELIDKGCQGWRLTRELRWTREKPTQPGWYWSRPPPIRCGMPVHLVIGHQDRDAPNGEKELGWWQEGYWYTVRLSGCEWAGPLTEPQEPTP